MNALTLSQIVVLAGVSCVVWALALGTYRLFFHPLRNVPGPKLAAMTMWVETYYECFYSPGGQFMWKYRQWHEQYGQCLSLETRLFSS